MRFHGNRSVSVIVNVLPSGQTCFCCCGLPGFFVGFRRPSWPVRWQERCAGARSKLVLDWRRTGRNTLLRRHWMSCRYLMMGRWKLSPWWAGGSEPIPPDVEDHPRRAPRPRWLPRSSFGGCSGIGQRSLTPRLDWRSLVQMSGPSPPGSEAGRQRYQPSRPPWHFADHAGELGCWARWISFLLYS